MIRNLLIKSVSFIAVYMLCGCFMCAVSTAADIQSHQPAAGVEDFPCDGIIQGLDEKYLVDIDQAISKQLSLPKVSVVKSFVYQNWSIFYVETYVHDPVYLFYSSSPLTSRYVARWGGWIDDVNEEPRIREWAIKNVPGIPVKLASCFAWEVTKVWMFPGKYPSRKLSY